MTVIDLLRIVIIYCTGAIFSTINIALNKNFYIEVLKDYCEEHKRKYNRLTAATMFTGLAMAWPIDIVYALYFKLR